VAFTDYSPAFELGDIGEILIAAPLRT